MKNSNIFCVCNKNDKKKKKMLLYFGVQGDTLSEFTILINLEDILQYIFMYLSYFDSYD